MQIRGISHSGDQTVSVHFFIKVVKIKHLMPHNEPLTFSDMLHRISVSSLLLESPQPRLL